MVKLRLSLVVCAYLTAAAGAFAQTSYVFQLPGSTGLTTQIVGKGDDNFSRVVIANSGPTAASSVIATPSGTKFYIVAPGGVFSANAALAGLAPVGGIPGGVKVAQVTPDGKYLLVVADQFYIVDTATDSVAAPPNTGVPSGATIVSVAASHDGKTAWLLSNSPSGSIVTTVDLTVLHAAVTTLNLLTTSSSMVLSSRNLLYVADSGATVYEIDPLSLTVTTDGKMTVPNGIAGPLQFTPDGNTALFLNRTSCPTCPAFFKLNAQAHSISGWLPPNGGTPPTLDQILVAGNNRVFAFTSGSNQLWDVTIAPLGLSPTILGAIPTGNVRAAAVSNERPSARYLYLSISDQSFYRVNLATNVVDGSSILDPASWTILSFVPIPAQSGTNSVFQVNPNQNVDPGGSAVLIGQVLDPVGRPVFGVPVSFSAPSCLGVSIATHSMVTTAEGWAQTAITAPAVTGTCTVTLTAGSLTADFQLLVGGSSSSGSSQISIYTGDGQLLRQSGDSTLSTQQPLTVKVTDASGDPLANVSVTFNVTDGPGQVTVHDAATDASGLAHTDFSTGTLAVGTHFQLTKVVASSTIGSVEFYEVTHDVASQSALNQPNTDVVTPQDRHLTIPQGGLISGGIQIATRSGTGGGAPIPNVGLRLADSTNFAALSPVVSCRGLSRGDNNGISSCDVVAACQPTAALPRDFTAIVSVGEFSSYALTVTVQDSVASLLTPVFPTTNLNGNPGDNITLIARVTDGCNNGAVVSGLQWTLQGSATLAQVQTTSDEAGIVKAQVSLGQTAGSVQVQLSGPNLTPIVFNLTTQVLVSALTLVSGGGQTVAVGQGFPNPVVFVARNANGNPVPGILVNFSASGGTVASASATTNAQGLVQTNVTAGATAGTIVVTASTTANLSATATLSSRLAGPAISVTSFTNAASGALGLTPCGLATVTGNGIAPNVAGVIPGVLFFGQWPTTLAGLSITANGVQVPLHSIANDQYGQRANFQAPCELTPGTNATVIVTVNGANTTVSVPVHLVQPGIFSYAGPNNKLYGAVISADDGTYVTPSNPARLGHRYFVVVTGLGLVTPAAVTNAAGTGSQDVVLPTIVGLSNRGVAVISARYMAGFIGAYLVEFEVPLDSPTGPDQPLAVAAGPFSDGTYVFGNPVFMPGVIAVP